jgi:glutamate formiminotransferase
VVDAARRGASVCEAAAVLECVINISEGRDTARIARIAAAAGTDLLDVHTDPHHHRSVLTVVGEDAARAITRAAVDEIDLTDHDGVHPRIGAVDVVPFVPLDGSTMADALDARDRFGEWAGTELGVPTFRYGPERTLPEIRRHAFVDLPPDAGPAAPHRSAGAIAVGARPILVAYNVWLAENDLALARRIASAVRTSQLRTLGLQVGDRVQVSMNLIDPGAVGPAAATDAVAALAPIAGCELVGLVPEAVVRAVPGDRWAALDLALDRTIEARLAGRQAP